MTPVIPGEAKNGKRPYLNAFLPLTRAVIDFAAQLAIYS
jgi:hypothetical protein